MKNGKQKILIKGMKPGTVRSAMSRPLSLARDLAIKPQEHVTIRNGTNWSRTLGVVSCIILLLACRLFPHHINYESGEISGWIRKFAASYSGQIVRMPVRRGKYAARFELRAGDDTGDGIRAEVKEMYCAPIDR
jgi:hypothetical protein